MDKRPSQKRPRLRQFFNGCHRRHEVNTGPAMRFGNRQSTDAQLGKLRKYIARKLMRLVPVAPLLARGFFGDEAFERVAQQAHMLRLIDETLRGIGHFRCP